jgi:hypothetical protein
LREINDFDLKIIKFFRKKMEILQVIKIEEVDEKGDVSLQKPHISEETPYIELVKKER